MGIAMKIELFHASKFGNGAMVAEELRKTMEARGHQMNVHHVKDAKPKDVPAADLYIFGSPTRIGSPRGNMKRFIKKVQLPAGAKYAVFATHGDATPNKKTGKMPTQEEIDRLRRTIPIMDGVLKGRGFVKVAEKKFFVRGDTMKGPLKDGWQALVQEFADSILAAK